MLCCIWEVVASEGMVVLPSVASRLPDRPTVRQTVIGCQTEFQTGTQCVGQHSVRLTDRPANGLTYSYTD